MTGEPISTVDYTFDVQGGPNPEWLVRRFHLTEGLSQPYALIVDVLTEEVGVNPEELLGASARLDIDRREVMRQVAGVIHRVDYVGVNVDRKLALRIHVVPALKLLSQDLGSRIYQDQTVPEILKAVLEPALSAFGREMDASGLSTSTEQYPKRDYCVRLRESALDFVSRLMEEDGITYYFRVTDNKEVMVLVDQSSGDPNTAFPEAEYIDPDGSGVIPIITDRPDTADRDSLRYFDWCQPLRPNQVMVRSFNWKAFDPNPKAQLETSSPAEDPSPLRRQYVFSAGRKAVDEQAGADPSSGFDGTAIDEPLLEAKRRYELYDSESQLGRGQSNVVGFFSGARFTLDDRSFPLLDQLDFLLTRITHRGEAPGVEASGSDDGPRYENTFECIPVGKPYRPSRTTPSPRVHGPQTATVTGGSGEEIHTDKHGRIKVRFHWDEHSALDGGSSCWVRVAQMWAGPGWGTVFIPRVGMEVVVEFLDGSPDRPLVTGCVYNSANTPPYPLPAEKTKSTIKSNSSVGGGGFNELRFEDAKGSEEVFIHAQKDMNEVVLNHHSTTVGHNQTHNVDVDRTRTVKGNELVTIEGNQTIIINGSPCGRSKSTCEVKGNNISVNDTYKLHADNQILLDAPNLFKLTVGGSTITVDPTSIKICAGGGSSIVLDSKIVAASSAKSTITMTGDINATSNSGSTLDLKGNAQLMSNDGSFINLTGNVDLGASTGANIVLTADATVNGGTVTLNGKSGQVVADGSGVGVSNGAIVIKGASVNIDGGGATGSFAGGMVKLN
ncbi:type VI secretion system Vgr family protein [Paraliomyxa miuraensis]|uniref:type VI secretion system Vgr family protein n=1 Tax=Paraliomyxa miuraensis TaxID=376150 RepID=UPI002258723D|nr:type VI secretion system tip protein TssI/VgrG [Paraliomyxa miuraensis]MCX4240627.1 type VI secretion system tip protein VgrG [Paraliomyxa miuraensis]